MSKFIFTLVRATVRRVVGAKSRLVVVGSITFKHFSLLLLFVVSGRVVDVRVVSLLWRGMTTNNSRANESVSG